MHAFVSFSNTVILEFMRSWLILKDFGKLDIALCSEDRFMLEELIRNTKNFMLPVLRNQPESIAANLSFLSWLIGRINVNDYDNSYFLNIQFDESDLISFSTIIHDLSTQKNFIRLFSNMRTLSIHGLSSDHSADISVEVLILTENLTQFNLLNAQELSFSDVFCAAAAYCPNITKFNCSNSCYVTEISVINICKECTHLRELDVENCMFMSEQLIFCCAINCNHLTALNIKGCNAINKNELMILATYSRKRLVRFETTCAISDFTLSMILHEWGAKLETLEIESKQKNKFISRNGLSDKGIAIMTTALLPKLTNLSIQNNQNLTTKSIDSIAQQLPQLEYLNVTKLPWFSYEHLETVSVGLTNVKRLQMEPYFTTSKFYGLPPLCCSIQMNNTYLAKYLIDREIGLNVCDQHYHRPPLMFALKHNELEIFELLLLAGVDVDISDNTGRNALLLAVEKDLKQQVRKLIVAGIDMDFTDKNGRTSWTIVCDYLGISNSASFETILAALESNEHETEDWTMTPEEFSMWMINYDLMHKRLLKN